MAWLLRMSTDDLDLDMKQIEAIGIIERTADGWLVKNFEKRQAPSTNTERTQEFRKRERQRQYNERETQLKRFVTQNTEEESESEVEAEQKPTTASRERTHKKQEPVYSDEVQLQSLYTRVTGQLAIPGTQLEPVLNALRTIRAAHGSDSAAVVYLKTYYLEWYAERHYSPVNATWLTDWAIAGSMPPKKAVPVPVDAEAEKYRRIRESVDRGV